MKTPPKAVVFDLGKVLVDFDYSIAARRLASRSRLDSQAIKHLIDHSTLLSRYETGLLSSEQFFREVSVATGFLGDFSEFSRFFADIFSPIPLMIEFQATLRTRGVPSYILSNTNDLAVTHIRRCFPFFNTFDGYVLSYQQGVLKPDPRIYEIVENQSGLRQAELLYFDDREENVAAALARGWQGITHHSPEVTLETVRALGL